MPRHPALHPTVAKLGGSVFSALTQRIAALEGEVYPLHVGDTWMEPDPQAVWASADDGGPDRPHRYTDPHGNGALVGAIVDKVRARNGLEISGPENVLVTTGATGALCASALATVSPGDDVLLLAPYWPLMPGIVLDAGGVPVEVPLIPGELDPDTVTAKLKEKVSRRTAAIYVNTPSNPSGRILHRPVLEAIAEFARAHDLWIWSDEVYEQYAYVADHLCIATLAPERTLTVFSFSKAYGLAGYRCGYIVGPTEAIAGVRKVGTHVWYSVPTPAQLVATRLLTGGDEWVNRAHESYRDTGYEAADRLGMPRPEGGTFLFFDVNHLLDERGLMGFLEDCLDDNLVLGPGPSFGPSYQTWTRLCFTCSPPDVVLRGVDKLATRIGG
jgi:aspartate/methionine/tyrosine aminotransferase